MDGSNPGLNLSEAYANYLSPITPDNTDTNQPFNYQLTFPWSCENGECDCSDINTMSDKPASFQSTADSSTLAEGDPYPSPTNTEAIIEQQIKEGICPLATGASNECKPELCGANAPCQAFWSVPEIEECTDAPCLTKLEDLSRTSSRTTLSQERQSSQPSAKRTRHDAGQTKPKSRTSTSVSPGPTIERSRTSESPKRHKKPKRPAPLDTKQAHSLVEKRYRENLTAKINELNVVLSCSADGGPSADTPSAKKSEILQTAIDYVNQSQLEMRHMTNDINRLNAKVKALERQAKCEDCSIVKNFDELRVLPSRGSSSMMNGIGASYDMAATSAG
jgi:Helix-loop-helix DNA-binding domain